MRPTHGPRNSYLCLFGALAVTFATACGSTVANQRAVAGPNGTADPSGLTFEQSDAESGLGASGTVADEGTTEDVAAGAAGGPTSGSQGGSGDATTPAVGGGENPAAGGGEAAVTAPIKVGLFSTDFAAAAAAIGASSEDSSSSTATADDIWKRLIRELNKRGGVGGRTIEAVSFVQDGTSNNYSADYQAACEFFARDQKVAVVLASSIPNTTFAACLLEAGIPSINVSQNGPSRRSWSRVPGLFLPSGVSADLAAVSIIDQLRADGSLTNKDKVGVILSECPESQHVYQNVVEPRLKQAGIAVEPFTANECIVGFSGVSSVAAGTQSAVLRFRSAGVTKVMPLLGSLENLTFALFAQNAESQRYYPGYILSTGARAEELNQAGQIPRKQLENVKGVGWFPSYDLFTLQIEQTPTGEACLELGQAAGVTPAVPVEQSFLLFSCDGLFFLDAVLDRSGGVSDAQSFIAAGRNLTDYVSTGMFGRPNDFRDIDAVEFAQVFGADASCGCIRYEGSPVRIAP